MPRSRRTSAISLNRSLAKVGSKPALSREDGVWVNVGITDSGGKDGWIPAADIGPTPPVVPVYDTNAYCEEVAAIASGSYAIEEGCLEMEAAAKATVEGTDIEPRIKDYCNELATSAGGSYSVLKDCIEMEMQARSRLNDS